MSPEKQRIAIAEECGYFYMDSTWHFPNGATADAEPETPCPPDFLNDLNAMHEAEEALSEEQRVSYSDELYDAACLQQKSTGIWRYLSMSAAHRAEAFLRTIGKWEDGE